MTPGPDPAGPLQKPEAQVDAQGNEQQDDPQGDGQFEIALIRFQGDGGGHDPGIAGDVPSHNNHRPHFGHHPAQAGHDARHDAVAGLPDDGEDFLQGRGPQGDGGLADHRVHPDDGGVGQGGDDGTGQDGLDHNHGGGGVEQAQGAQGSAPGEKEVEEEPGHHRRQAHAGVDQADDQTPEGHPAPGQGRAQGQTQEGGDHQGRSRDLEGQEDDGQELRVEGEDELPGPDKSVEDGVHRNDGGQVKSPGP